MRAININQERTKECNLEHQKKQQGELGRAIKRKTNRRAATNAVKQSEVTREARKETSHVMRIASTGTRKANREKGK
jgi:hypothetical protein